MTRSELRTFIETGANSLNSSVYYDCGLITSLNSINSIEYPFVWLVSPNTTPEITESSSLLFDNWSVEIHVGMQDKIDSVQDQYEAILDECDMLARKLILLYNQSIEGYSTATITGLSINPFIKKHAHCATGVILSFTINAPDTTNLC